jgi:hypothetical protein
MNEVGCEVLASLAVNAAYADNQVTIAAAGAIPVILTDMTVQTLITHFKHSFTTLHSRQKHSLKPRAQETALRAQETAAKRSRYLKAFQYAGRLARNEIDVMDNKGKIKKISHATIAQYANNRFALQFPDGAREKLISASSIRAAKTSSHPPQSRGPPSRKRPLSDVDDDGMHVDTSTLEEGGLRALQVEARLLADQMMQDEAASAAEDDDASAAEDDEASSADERPDPEPVEQPVEQFSRYVLFIFISELIIQLHYDTHSRYIGDSCACWCCRKIPMNANSKAAWDHHENPLRTRRRFGREHQDPSDHFQ